MKIQQLDVYQLRNLSHKRLDFGPHFNLITGPNGSGKTSLLEAIYLLGLGRSFRASKAQEVITLEKESLSVSALIETPAPQGFGAKFRVGIEKSKRGETKVRLAEEAGATIAELVELLPTQLLNAISFQILEAGPQNRREFVDWGVFHVEHEFKHNWRRYKRALNQRNALLKQKTQGLKAVAAWDQEITVAGEAITRQRQSYIQAWLPVFQEVLTEDMGLPFVVDCQYKRGWAEGLSFQEALSAAVEQDWQYGSTSLGPHRSDIQLKIHGLPVKTLLSRGQAKLFICAMLIARARLLVEHKGAAGVFLLDDLTSELDATSCARLIKALEKLNTQVFITGIEDSVHVLPALSRDNTSFFTVSNGLVERKEGVGDNRLASEVELEVDDVFV